MGGKDHTIAAGQKSSKASEEERVTVEAAGANGLLVGWWKGAVGPRVANGLLVGGWKGSEEGRGC